MRIDEFLTARIAEVEALALAAGGEEWWAVNVSPKTHRDDEPTKICIDSNQTLVSYEVTRPPMAEHIAYHHPARIEADCEAKRRIVERHHVREVSPSCAECGGYTATPDAVRGIVHHGYAIPWPCPTLRALASVYADHPDFDPAWAIDVKERQ